MCCSECPLCFWERRRHPSLCPYLHLESLKSHRLLWIQNKAVVSVARKQNYFTGSTHACLYLHCCRSCSTTQGTAVGRDRGWWRRRQTQWWGTGTRRGRRLPSSSGWVWRSLWLPCSPSSSALSPKVGPVPSPRHPLPSSAGRPLQRCLWSP